jgi:uncharacterized protein (TIGR03437 family)
LGSHVIVAKFTGDASTQASLGQVVNGIASTTTVSANSPAVFYGQAVIVTAQVGPVPPAGFTAPAGRVTFLDNSTPAGGAILTSGAASLTLNSLAVGTHQLTAVYAGDQIWASSFARITVIVKQQILRVTNAATDLFSILAPDEIASIYNVTALNGDTVPSSWPPPTSLAGVTVKVADSAGRGRLAQLYAVLASTGQVNFVVPGDSAPGPATVTVTQPDGARLSADISISRIAPGIFAPGQVFHIHANGVWIFESTAAPVHIGDASDQAFLILYGTGIRHRLSADSVTATINRVRIPVQSAPQGLYPGLDQLNLELPHSLAGAGFVEVAISVEGQSANPIPLYIE